LITAQFYFKISKTRENAIAECQKKENAREQNLANLS